MSIDSSVVRPTTLAQVSDARCRLEGTVLRSPLIPLELGPEFPSISIKVEAIQPTNSYKIRGALNAVALLSDGQRAAGIWTVSAGNAGQAIAFAARQAGVPCTVVVVETAPRNKLQRMKDLGAELILVSSERAWKVCEDREFEGVEGTFVHPFDDDNFIAGSGTIGLEILEDAPDTTAVIVPVGGGGLAAGVGSAIKAVKPGVRVWAAEPDTAAPLALSMRNKLASRFPGWRPSFVDGAGGQSIFPRMWERVKDVVDGSIVVDLEQVRRAMRVIAEAQIVSEGAGALALAAAMTWKAGPGPLVAIVSGGNIDLKDFAALIAPTSSLDSRLDRA